MSLLHLLFSISTLLLLQRAVSIPLSEFFPFGTEAGDAELPSNDDGSSPAITLSTPFPFFAETETDLYVNNNGDISFEGSFSTFTSQPFPLESGLQLIAPFWADVDTRGGRGSVWYRDASSDSSLLVQARNEIRMAFVNQMNFEPTFLFIATWESVGFFGGTSSSLRNTFQCILVSDGQRSFVIFFYADGLIQWTTGTSSGGVDAQVGFNAGDGIRFASVPGSRTPEIINIDTTSNVGRGGVWIFRVDEEEIAVSDCDNAAPLRTAPRLGNMLGGTPIVLAGPCFTPGEVITCTFDEDTHVMGMYISEVLAVCVSPYFETRGWKDLTLNISTEVREVRYTGQGRFYAVSFQDSADILFTVEGEDATPNLHLTPDMSVSVTWNPDSFVPMTDPALFRVDVALSMMNSETGEWERLEVLSRDERNDGEVTVTIPIVGSQDSGSIDTAAVAIEVVVATPPVFGNFLTEAESFLVDVIKLWSPVAFYSRILDQASNLLRRECQDWLMMQSDTIGEEINARLPPCPRVVTQARAPNSRFREDRGLARFLSRNFFHHGADTCFRQTTFTEANMRSGQQCCYNTDGTLATGIPSGGTVDLVSPEISTREHFIVDVLPSIACCFGAFSSCNLYYQHRPSDNGSRYNPPPPACVYGDPHIVTLDGFKYTFNGHGEYDLIRTPQDQFTLQGRMEVPRGGSLQELVQATVFTAVVAKEAESDTVQIQLSSEGDSLELLMNGNLVDFSDLSEQEFMGVTVTDLGSDALSATFSSGVYVEAREANGIMSTLLVSAHVDYQGTTSGLMGNFNGEQGDDLVARGGEEGISLTSSLEDIHNLFGVTWIVSMAEDSLFTYSEGTSFSTFYNPTFVPAFSPTFATPELAAQASSMCGQDQFCLFDVAATGSMEIGLSTLQGNVEFETIVNISIPVSCFPPCENGVCVAENVCSCSGGYTGTRCSDPIFTACDVNPCENGGNCRILAGSYICSCPFGFSGSQCQIEEGVDLEPVDFLTECFCQRELECSVTGTFDSQSSGVTPTGPSLQCVISFPTFTIPIMEGDETEFSASPFAVDRTFDANFLSAGSLSFLRAVGVISRESGVTDCSLQSATRSLLQELGVGQISLIFQSEGGQFDSISLNMNTVGQIFQSGDFSIMEQLDDDQTCSLQYLLDTLSRPPTNSTFFCRNTLDSDLSTVITFRVLCDE